MQAVKTPRSTIRFPLEEPVQFWWTDEQGLRHSGEGFSRDISECGAFVLSAICPPVGARVELSIPLEDLSDTTGINLDGCVVRVDQIQGKEAVTGFAVFKQFP